MCGSDRGAMGFKVSDSAGFSCRARGLLIAMAVATMVGRASGATSAGSPAAIRPVKPTPLQDLPVPPPGQLMECFDAQTGHDFEYRAEHLFSSGALDHA